MDRAGFEDRRYARVARADDGLNRQHERLERFERLPLEELSGRRDFRVLRGIRVRGNLRECLHDANLSSIPSMFCRIHDAASSDVIEMS